MPKLTKKQSVFIDEYMVDFNAAHAARAAGYSKDTAKEIGCENLTKPHIYTEIAKRLAKRAEKTGIDADWVQKKLVRNEKKAYTNEDIGESRKHIELLGKTCGAFNNDTTKDTTVNIYFKQPEEG